MKLEHQELLKEFYDNISPHFPGLTLQQLNKICCSPFFHLKKMMEKDEFNYMRLQYFGSFIVYPGKAKHKLKVIDKFLAEGILSKEDYDRFKKMYTDYLEKHENNKI